MIFKIPLVIPTRVSWLVLMLLIGIFSLVAQVCSYRFLPDLDYKIAKVLLALGFQRETASRGSVALYTLVRVPPHAVGTCKLFSARLSLLLCSILPFFILHLLHSRSAGQSSS
jgi:hypothetical protein